MRLDKRRDRSDLIVTFRVLNGNYRVDKDLFFVPDDGGRRGHSRKLFKRRCRLDIKNSLLAIELLITGTVFQITVLVALSLYNFTSNMRLHWDWKPNSTV